MNITTRTIGKSTSEHCAYMKRRRSHCRNIDEPSARPGILRAVHTHHPGIIINPRFFAQQRSSQCL